MDIDVTLMTENGGMHQRWPEALPLPRIGEVLTRGRLTYAVTWLAWNYDDDGTFLGVSVVCERLDAKPLKPPS